MEAIQRLWIPIKIRQQSLKEVQRILLVAAGFAALYLCAKVSGSSYEDRTMWVEKGSVVISSGSLAELPEMREEYEKILIRIFAEKNTAGVFPEIVMPEGIGNIEKENVGKGITKLNNDVQDRNMERDQTDVVDYTNTASSVDVQPKPETEVLPAVLNVYIYGNGGVPEFVENTYYPEEFMEDVLEKPRRLGKVFDGWYEDEACTIPFSGLKEKQDTLTLYAGWKEFPGFICNDKGYITGCTGSAEAISDGILIVPNHADCTGIAKGAFDDIKDEVFEICILPNIIHIEPEAFAGLSNLAYIEVLPGNPVYYSEEGILYYNNGSVAAYPPGRMELD